MLPKRSISAPPMKPTSTRPACIMPKRLQVPVHQAAPCWLAGSPMVWSVAAAGSVRTMPHSNRPTALGAWVRRATP